MVDQISKLRLYIDSVDSRDWAAFFPSGLFFGVTTNPKLLAESGTQFEIQNLAELAENAFLSGAEEIHLQLWGKGISEMLDVGRQLGGIDERVKVKIPATLDGIHCARQLIQEGIGVTLTALHAANQALMAAALGVDYAAPYLGRMNDGGLNGLEEVIRMQRIFDKQRSSARLLVASIRVLEDLVWLAENGLNTFTLRPTLIEDLFQNDLTRLAAKSFQDAVDKTNR